MFKVVVMEFQACLVPIIRRHGGIVDKFLGDGIMATAATEQSSPETWLRRRFLNAQIG